MVPPPPLPPASSPFLLAAGLSQQLQYDWGGERWKEATWAKVHVVAAVVAYGFNVIYSDTDVSWFRVWEGRDVWGAGGRGGDSFRCIHTNASPLPPTGPRSVLRPLPERTSPSALLYRHTH